MSRQYSLPWLIAVMSLTAALLAIFLPHLLRPKALPSRFPVADGMFARAETVDLTPTTKLYLRYSPIADEGVELEFVANGYRKWYAYMEPLGTPHSSYSHSVECFLKGNELRIRSRGSYGEIVEDRDMANGKLLAREVHVSTD